MVPIPLIGRCQSLVRSLFVVQSRTTIMIPPTTTTQRQCERALVWLWVVLLTCVTRSVESMSSISMPNHGTNKPIAIHRVPFSPSLPSCQEPLSSSFPVSSWYCYAVSNPMDVMDGNYNFLATQVWPTARVAAHCLVQAAVQLHKEKPTRTMSAENASSGSSGPLSHLTVCELGCGPGLPSLTAAALGAKQVFATDVDALALRMVQTAAHDQGWSDRVQASRYDLLSCCGSNHEYYSHDKDENCPKQEFAWPPAADLYLLSDVFESSHVARGAARLVHALLFNHNNDNDNKKKTRVWVFCQTDRVQKDAFLETLHELQQQQQHADKNKEDSAQKDDLWEWTLYQPRDQSQPTKVPSLALSSSSSDEPLSSLWLCSVDETTVPYTTTAR